MSCWLLLKQCDAQSMPCHCSWSIINSYMCFRSASARVIHFGGCLPAFRGPRHALKLTDAWYGFDMGHGTWVVTSACPWDTVAVLEARTSSSTASWWSGGGEASDWIRDGMRPSIICRGLPWVCALKCSKHVKLNLFGLIKGSSNPNETQSGSISVFGVTRARPPKKNGFFMGRHIFGWSSHPKKEHVPCKTVLSLSSCCWNTRISLRCHQPVKFWLVSGLLRGLKNQFRSLECNLQYGSLKSSYCYLSNSETT